MSLNGQTLICIESFFIFKEGWKYYCSHVVGDCFFIAKAGSEFNVSYIKVPFAHANKFKIVF